MQSQPQMRIKIINVAGRDMRGSPCDGVTITRQLGDKDITSDYSQQRGGWGEGGAGGGMSCITLIISVNHIPTSTGNITSLTNDFSFCV